MRAEQLAGELDGFLIADAAMHRPADIQIVVCGILLCQEMRPIGDTDVGWNRQRIGEDMAVTVRHADRGGHVIADDLLACPLIEVKPGAQSGIERTCTQQGLIDLADAAQGAFFERLRKVAGRVRRLYLGGSVLVVEAEADADP